MLTILGIITIVAIVLLLVSNRVHPIVVFAIVPLITGLIAVGGNLDAVGAAVDGGISGMGGIAALFIFSMLFFNIMAETGVFDVIIDRLLASGQGSVAKICVVTAVIALISHLDGVGTTTIAITTGAMLPIYKRMRMRPEVLLLILFLITAAFGYLPWSAMMIYSGSVVSVYPGTLFKETLPLQGICFAVSILFIAIITLRESARVRAIAVNNGEASDEAQTKVKNGRFLGVNIALTILVITGLIASILPAGYLFMLGCAVAMLINFREFKDQVTLLKENGKSIMLMVGTVFSIGVFTGVLTETGMIDAMTSAFLTVLPEEMGGKLCFLIALVSVPLMFFLGNQPLTFAILPIIAGISAQYGLDTLPAVSAILIGCNYGSGLSPSVAPLFMALSATELEYGKYLKFAFPWLFAASVVVVLLAGIVGILPI